MPELEELLHAAAPKHVGEVEVAAIIRRGNRTARTQRIAMVALPAALALALALTVRVAPTSRVDFIAPADRLPAPTPEAVPQRRQSQLLGPRVAVDGDNKAGPHPPAAKDPQPPVEASPPDLRPPDHAPRPAGSSAVAGNLATREDAQDEQPRATPTPTLTPTPTPTTKSPPEAAGCTVTTADLQPGESTSCAFTATTVGGYYAAGNGIAQSYRKWYVEVVHDGESTVYAEGEGGTSFRTSGFCADDVIQPGDVVTVWVRRPPATEGVTSNTATAGRDAGCPSG